MNQPCMWIPNKNRQMGRQEQMNHVKKSSLKWTEPKRALFARRERLVKVGHEQPRKPSLITPTVEAGESAKESRLTCTKETKSRKIKNFYSGDKGQSSMHKAPCFMRMGDDCLSYASFPFFLFFL